MKRILVAIFVAGASVLVLTGMTLVGSRVAGDPTFIPYLWILAGSMLSAGAWAMHVGYLHVVGSDEPALPDAAPFAEGWFAVKPHRPLTATRMVSTGAASLLLIAGASVFGHYLTTSPVLHPSAGLVLAGWALLTGRISWGALRSNATGGRVEDAKLLIRPGHASPGASLAVRLQQTALRTVEMRGVEASLVALRTSNPGEDVPKVKTIQLDRLQIHSDVRTLTAGQVLSADATFFVPEDLAQGGTLTFRLHVRTRLSGFDYKAWYPIPSLPPVSDGD